MIINVDFFSAQKQLCSNCSYDHDVLFSAAVNSWQSAAIYGSLKKMQLENTELLDALQLFAMR
jgi:hypothetical protein